MLWTDYESYKALSTDGLDDKFDMCVDNKEDFLF